MKEIYESWLANTKDNKEIKAELESIKGNEEEIKERFYKELAFGTGGLRGVLGAGTNRINVFTVKKATQGLCSYLTQEFKEPSIAIAYDSRKNSFLFAKAAAEVFVANNIMVHIFSELMPTPILSYAVRNLNCSGGIVITASHNPAKYNGYKVYGSDGCQITLDAAKKITKCIDLVDTFNDVKCLCTKDILLEKMVNIISDDTINAYFEEVHKCSVFSRSDEANLKVVYTPLNGAGNKPVARILAKTGIHDIIMVKEQQNPDSTFSTCPYPNPEEKDALKLGIELAKQVKGDILLATDPDCDRVGTAVKHKEEYVLINGNQMGVMLLDFICKTHIKNATMPKNPFCVKTIVTTQMAQAVADKYNVILKNVLTGFKFIGEQITLLETKNEEQRYIFGFEESYGYLSGTYVRDKDAVNAAMIICEMAAYYKLENKTLVDVLNELYRKYGYYYDKLESSTFEGAFGMEKMKKIMADLRKSPFENMGKHRVTAVYDYFCSKKHKNKISSQINLPQSDVMAFEIEGSSSVVIRPSGTEPKLKVYYSLKCVDEVSGKAMFEEISSYIKDYVI